MNDKRPTVALLRPQNLLYNYGDLDLFPQDMLAAIVVLIFP